MRQSIEGLNLKALRAFVAVCEKKSMVDAARILGVTPSAISQLIGSLEQDQGVPLFDRRYRPARLNAAGTALLEHAESLLNHAQVVSRSVRAAYFDDHLQLRIGAPASVCSTLGPSIISELSGDFRAITFHSGLAAELFEQVSNREIDVAICTSAPPEHKRLVGERLFAEQFVLAIPAAAADRTYRSLRSVIDSLPMLRYSGKDDLGASIERYTHHVGLSAPKRYELDLSAPLLAMVAKGMGCAITTPLCLWQGREYLDDLSLISLPASPYGRREFVLVSRQNEIEAVRHKFMSVPLQTILSELAGKLRGKLRNFPDQPFEFFDTSVGAA